MTRALVVIVAAIVGIVALAMLAEPSDAAGRLGPPIGRFECSVYKTLRMDPIFKLEGQKSHLHHFVGNPHVYPDSTGWSLAREEPAYTTCTRLFETSAVWFPALYDDSGRLPVTRFVWYFRGLGDQENVIVPPKGLELIGRDGKGDVFWRCGAGVIRNPSPPQGGTCPAGQSVRMAVFLPNCLKDPVGPKKPEVTWRDGANVSYVEDHEMCPKNYLPLPEERISIDFDNVDGIQGRLKVSAEEGGLEPAATAAHLDIMHGEQEPVFAKFIDKCIRSRPDRAVPSDYCRSMELAPNPER